MVLLESLAYDLNTLLTYSFSGKSSDDLARSFQLRKSTCCSVPFHHFVCLFCFLFFLFFFVFCFLFFFPLMDKLLLDIINEALLLENPLISLLSLQLHFILVTIPNLNSECVQFAFSFLGEERCYLQLEAEVFYQFDLLIAVSGHGRLGYQLLPTKIKYIIKFVFI